MGLVMLSQVKLTMKFFVRTWILLLIFILSGVMDIRVGELKFTCLRVVPLISRRERNFFEGTKKGERKAPERRSWAVLSLQ